MAVAVDRDAESTVKKIAAAYHRTLPHGAVVDFDDLVQVGLVAWWRAGESYDPSKGATFKTYGSRRARFAMVDHVRDTAHGKRNGWSDLTIIADFEVLDGNSTAVAQAPAPDAADPDASDHVASLLCRLDARHRLAIMRRYRDGWRVKRIGAELGVSESRASQMLERAMQVMAADAGKGATKRAAEVAVQCPLPSCKRAAICRKGERWQCAGCGRWFEIDATWGERREVDGPAAAPPLKPVPPPEPAAKPDPPRRSAVRSPALREDERVIIVREYRAKYLQWPVPSMLASEWKLTPAETDRELFRLVDAGRLAVEGGRVVIPGDPPLSGARSVPKPVQPSIKEPAVPASRSADPYRIPQVVEAVAYLHGQTGLWATVSGVAAKLNCSQTHARARLTEAIEAGAIEGRTTPGRGNGRLLAAPKGTEFNEAAAKQPSGKGSKVAAPGPQVASAVSFVGLVPEPPASTRSHFADEVGVLKVLRETIRQAPEALRAIKAFLALKPDSRDQVLGVLEGEQARAASALADPAPAT